MLTLLHLELSLFLSRTFPLDHGDVATKLLQSKEFINAGMAHI